MEYNDLIRYFISNIQDIDDMLGPEPKPLSPGRRCESVHATSTRVPQSNLSSIRSESGGSVEEVPVAVVKVHDSAAQRAQVCPLTLASPSPLLLQPVTSGARSMR